VRTFTANESRMPPSSASDDPRVRITEAVAEQRRNATFRPLGGAAQRSAMQERMRATPYPETWPAYGRIHDAPDGTLWVQDYKVSFPAPDVWTAFDSSGRLLGRLQMPSPATGDIALEVMEFGTNEILLRRRDAEFAVHLAVYTVIRSPTRDRDPVQRRQVGRR
jgi:hypothetical protein